MPSRHREIVDAIERAQDQTETLEAREAALEELRERGALEELGTMDDFEHPDDLHDIDVESELAALKEELRD